MIIDCIADLHGHLPDLTGGDLLIIAGDLTARDTEKQHDDFWRWVVYQNYKKVIVTAGNHDNYLQQHPHCLTDCGENLCYLCDSATEFEGLKIWGSPWSMTFQGMNHKCKAFTVDTEEELEKKFALIPEKIDILVTHSPPWGMLDQNRDGYLCGSHALRNALDRVKPRLNVFGHIHEQGGQQMMYKHKGPNTWCVNASYVDERYKPVNKPIRIELPK